MNTEHLTPEQRRNKYMNELERSAEGVDREGLNLFMMEEGVPYLFRLDGPLVEYTTKDKAKEWIANIVEVTTGESGVIWLGKTRLSNIFDAFQEYSDNAPKDKIGLLKLVDGGIQEAPECKGGKARAYTRTFMYVDAGQFDS